jgi:5-methylcytosine-specific restriction endonuclease McrA
MTNLPRKKKFRSADEPEFDAFGRRIRIKHPPELKEKLAEAQNHRCCLCGGALGVVPADAEVRTPSRWSASLEHVVPFSQGGADDETNLVVTHQACNEARVGQGAPS